LGLAEKVVSAPSSEDFDATQNVVGALLFESRNGEQLVRTAQFFEFLNALDLEAIVNGLCRLGSDTRNSHQFHQPGGNFPLEILEESHFSRLDVLHNFLCQIVADARNLAD